MLRLMLVLVPLALAGCGADGVPVAPSKAAAGGVTISGEAKIGVVGGS